MATNGTTSNNKPLRIVVGSDNAGHTYKAALKEALNKHAGVASVLDVGVVDADDVTAYPHLAVDACKKIKAGEVRFFLNYIQLQTPPSNPKDTIPLTNLPGRPRPPNLRHRSRRRHLRQQGVRDPRRDGARPVQRRARGALERRAGAVFRTAGDWARAGEEAGAGVGGAPVRSEQRQCGEGEEY